MGRVHAGPAAAKEVPPGSTTDLIEFTVVETDPVGMCCGAAGIYTMTHPETSERLGNQKADQIRRTGVSRVASANPGCEMQLRAHLDGEHEVRHPIEWYLLALKGSR